MKLSIVTVARNALADLKSTLECLLSQHAKDIEIVVVDGASTDGTVDYLKSVSGTNNFKWISEPDTGIYNAMNKGIQLASGDFVYFLNAGDELTSIEALDSVVRQLGTSDVYYCDVYLKSRERTCLRKYNNELTLDFWILEYMCHQAVFFNKDLFTEFGSHQEKYRFAADFDFLFHAWTCRKSFKHLDVAIAIYDLHGTSASPANIARVHREYAEIQRQYLSPPLYLYSLLLKAANEPTSKTATFATKLRRKIVRKILRPFFSRKQGFEFDFLPNSLPVPRGLRVLHVNTYAGAGGAAVASLRLHHALLAAGIQSQYACLSSFVDDPTIKVMVHKSGLKLRIQNFVGIFEGAMLRWLNLRRKGLLSPGLCASLDWERFQTLLNQFNPDVIHLHWVNHGLLTIKDIAGFDKPLVWTFHDMWAMLGLDHVSLGSEHLDGYTTAGDDYRVDRYVWRQKLVQWSHRAHLTKVICPSLWMRDQAVKSPIWKKSDIRVIGNCVPTREFFPVDQALARQILNIGSDTDHVILFGAASPFTEPVKGYAMFMEALEIFLEGKDRSRVMVGTFGDSRGKYIVSGVQHRHFGILTSVDFQRAIYSSADVLVVASELESFCLVAAEAEACGTPVACFDTSGLRDVVVDGKTGFRSKEKSAQGLADAMNWVISDQQQLKQLGKNAEDHVKAQFDSAKVAGEHVKLYEELLREDGTPYAEASSRANGRDL